MYCGLLGTADNIRLGFASSLVIAMIDQTRFGNSQVGERAGPWSFGGAATGCTTGAAALVTADAAPDAAAAATATAAFAEN